MQGENQSCGEIYEALGIGFAHVGDVHNHRDTVTEVLTNDFGIIVRTRVHGCNLTQFGILIPNRRGTFDGSDRSPVLGFLLILIWLRNRCSGSRGWACCFGRSLGSFLFHDSHLGALLRLAGRSFLVLDRIGQAKVDHCFT